MSFILKLYQSFPGCLCARGCGAYHPSAACRPLCRTSRVRPTCDDIHPSAELRRALQTSAPAPLCLPGSLRAQLLRTRQHAHISFLVTRSTAKWLHFTFFRGKSSELCGPLCFFPLTRIICRPSILKTKRKLPEDCNFLILLLQTLTCLLPALLLLLSLLLMLLLLFLPPLSPLWMRLPLVTLRWILRGVVQCALMT